MPKQEQFIHTNEKSDEDSDRIDSIYGSIEIDFSNLNYHDAMTIIGQMPNKRLRRTDTSSLLRT